MKWGVVILTLAISGCATVEDVQKSMPTMSVISGKDPKAFSECVVGHLATSRKPSLIEPHKEGYRVIVPQKISSGPAAIVDIEKTSNGSSVKLYEHLSNVPMRPKDVSKAVTSCISGD